MTEARTHTTRLHGMKMQVADRCRLALQLNLPLNAALKR
jgi:hypothetical protein